ncbi:MAG: hypothetical protein A2X67_08475 [Ignavibacteria bacterium GWA2_55_11]|nr:MAG: hypothetical protein A2X67_08475 [Ignavibacteria bacterium GWA2_55_11]OGU65842.1 MAG: hypothetical protein A3C56_13020 [Ignavibacteria bacterium RIFCSPHIGHO2_02_FULL_56_12]OGU69826.1 MAG: hypothetical protein A3H45_15435 [Ignavibacteria bacterium RIFCSPLOWO2_02_FULL_55_14]OGU70530.1 MAG: hypothetical protein A3G43_13390 [Ignavibacteria bacterium RIFCSPLOWO2_12_FULL_56_21]
MSESFPRKLTDREMDLLSWVLPEDRPGYAAARMLTRSWSVAARGRRGDGNYILAPEGTVVDVVSPLPQVLAYGVVETGTISTSVTVRERMDVQLEFEIVDNPAFGTAAEPRRWSYSTWLPSSVCPQCGRFPRDVRMSTEGNRLVVLAICMYDRRLWVFDDRSGVNHPVPVTNFYSELMSQTGVRDPRVALRPELLFEQMSAHADDDLARAFVSYNTRHAKIPADDPVLAPESRRPLFGRLFSLFYH